MSIFIPRFKVGPVAIADEEESDAGPDEQPEAEPKGEQDEDDVLLTLYSDLAGAGALYLIPESYSWNFYEYRRIVQKIHQLSLPAGSRLAAGWSSGEPAA